MGQLAKASGTDSLQQDLLYTQAGHYYTFGQTAKGDAAISQLTDQYKKSKQYTKMLDCYHKLIDMGKHSNNATLTSRAYEQLILWQDSIRTLKAQDETAALKKECADKQAVINEKESSLKGHKATIYALCGVAGILGIVLVVGGLVMVRFIVLTRKQKRAINALREHSELKDKFILGISAQTAPTLEQLDHSHPATKALKEFFSHIEALTHQESLLTEPCEMEEKRIDTFCEHLTSQIREKMDKEVTLVVKAPKLSMKMNSEMLETRGTQSAVWRQRYGQRHRGSTASQPLQALHQGEGPDKRRRSGPAHLCPHGHTHERQSEDGRGLHQGHTFPAGPACITPEGDGLSCHMRPTDESGGCYCLLQPPDSFYSRSAMLSPGVS